MSRPAAHLTPVSEPAGPVICQKAPPIGLAGPWSGFSQEKSKSLTRRQSSPPARVSLRGWAGGLLSMQKVWLGVQPTLPAKSVTQWPTCAGRR